MPLGLHWPPLRHGFCAHGSPGRNKSDIPSWLRWNIDRVLTNLTTLSRESSKAWAYDRCSTHHANTIVLTWIRFAKVRCYSNKRWTPWSAYRWFQHSRISQEMLSKPTGHKHMKLPGLVDWQVPPFRQGLGAHGSSGGIVIALPVISGIRSVGALRAELLTQIAGAACVSRWAIASKWSAWFIENTWSTVLTRVRRASITW